MELLVLLLIIGTFALWVSNRNLKIRIDALERAIGVAAPGTAPVPAPAPMAPPPAEPESPPPPAVPERRPMPEAVAVPAETREEEERETIGGLFERLVAGRLLIWIGGVALAVAGIFLIRYSIGLITPEVRMVGAALFGVALLIAGEYARAGRLLSDDPRFAQALVGAGIAVLYATAYGSHILYGLIGTGGASAAMLAVTGAALFLSLRHGAPTAVMGLVGGFLTPLLVGDPDASAVSLLAYLGLIDLAIFLIAWRRGWTWLAAAAVTLSFVWTAWLLSQPPEDALAAGVFVIMLAVAASLVQPGPGRQLGLIQPLSIGIVQLGLLVARTDLGLPAWTLFGTLAAACMALAVLRPAQVVAPAAALGLGLMLLLAKASTGLDPHVPLAAIGITALFGLGGLALLLWRRRLLWSLLACAGFVGPVLILRAARPELLERPAWGGLALLLALGPVALAWLDRERASDKTPDPSLFAAGAGFALLSGVAAWDLVPADWVAAVWLAVALVVALAARRLGDRALTWVALAAAGAGALRGVAVVPELWTAAADTIGGMPALAAQLPGALDAFYALALPALLLFALQFLLVPPAARRAVLAAAGLFAAAALYLWFKRAYGLASMEDFYARGLAERTILTQALFAIGWLLATDRVRVPRIDETSLRRAGGIVTAVAAARLIWFDILVYNPAMVRHWVGPLPVLNLILPAYLVSAFWLYRARRGATSPTRSGFWLAAFLAALIGGVGLMVRQAFHGAVLTGPELPIAEFYGYSLAGLLVSIGLLVAGIRLPDKALRLAGLLLLTATISKVFLVDASELEGVLRILSFLGLGIALIGIGRLYGPVLRAGREGAAKQAA